MLVPRGLPAPICSALGAVVSPTGSVVGEPINLADLSPMRSSGYMLGKHLLNNRGFPNALTEKHDGEAPTK